MKLITAIVKPSLLNFDEVARSHLKWGINGHYRVTEVKVLDAKRGHTDFTVGGWIVVDFLPESKTRTCSRNRQVERAIEAINTAAN